MSTHWTPPTVTPEAGQGPWCSTDLSRWWVVADRPDQALAEVISCEGVPDYLGWQIVVEPVFVRWVAVDEWNEENEIEEAEHDDGHRTVLAFRITISEEVVAVESPRTQRRTTR